MADIQDEGATTDESDRKSEDGTLMWSQTDTDVACKLEENSSSLRSQSIIGNCPKSLIRSRVVVIAI